MKRSLTIAFLFVAVFSVAQASLSAPAARPKLIVGIAIDQFRADYLERFSDLFGEDGFRRLLQEGAVFADAQHLHSVTVTAPGHAAFMTGTVPTQNGIIANEWFDRAEGKKVSSVSDDGEKPVGSSSGNAASPHRLIGSTLGDELKLSNGGVSRVIGISMKDRAAILPAGHHPNGAFWFDSSTGQFITSTYYMKELPSWAIRFNSSHPADAYFGKTWTKLRPEADYKRSGIDDSPYESPETKRRVFPYVINGGDKRPSPAFYEQLLVSPFSNELLLAFAKAAIEGEHLGEHEVTDLLTISFSCNDTIGHNYGPYSHEVEDVTLRTDIVLSDLFHYLDSKLGRDGYVVALTADHGAAPSPEQAQALGLGGGRYSDSEVVDAASNALQKKFGAEKWILAYEGQNLYLDHAAAARHNVRVSDLARTAADAILQLEPIAFGFTEEDLTTGRLPADPFFQRFVRNYFPGRTGDVLVVQKPYYISGKNTTGHGSPYSYDSSVPVILWGPYFIPGRYSSAASPADIAPTLAFVLHIIRPSNAVGRVLTEALVSPSTMLQRE